jgi:hypothetical protein
MKNKMYEQLEHLLAELPYGDGLLYARDILKDEWTEQTEQVAQALYNHEPFDLQLLTDTIDSPDFSYENKNLLEWIQTVPQRRVAAMVCRIVLDSEFNKVVDENQALQDYYAENVHPSSSVNWQQVDACEAFTQRALNGMGEVARHYEEARKWGLEGESLHVVDMVWGWAPHVFEEDTVATGREILEVANQCQPDKLTIRSDAGARAYIDKVMKQVQQIAEKHDVDIDITDVYSLTTGYLCNWLMAKYWGNQRKEDEEWL